MGSKTREVVEQFYQSNFYKDKDVLKSFLHPEVELSWYGTTGLKKLNLSGIAEISQQLAESYESLRAEVEKTIVDGPNAAIHFSYHVRTIENPEEEMPLAHFVAMWEVKEGKLFKGVQVSQLGEEVEEDPWI